MCLAVPAEIKSIDGNIGEADFGGVKSSVNLSLVEANVGDYVIVHAGFAIHSLVEEEAKKNLALLRELAETMPEELLTTRESDS